MSTSTSERLLKARVISCIPLMAEKHISEASKESGVICSGNSKSELIPQHTFSDVCIIENCRGGCFVGSEGGPRMK